MVSIENLEDNLIQMRNEMKSWQEAEVMDAEDDLHNLTDPVSLSKIMESYLEVINLMSTSSDSHPPKATPNIFPISGLGGIPVASTTSELVTITAL